MPILRLLLAVLVAALVAAPSAVAGTPFGLGAITDQLQATHLAVDPDADLTPAQRRSLENAVTRLRAADIPADIVVLAQDTLGPNAVAEELYRRLNYQGVQVVIVQEPLSLGFYARSLYDFEPEHERIQSQASATLKDDLAGTAERVARQAWAASLAIQERYRNSSDDDDERSGFWRAAPGLLLFLLVAVFLVRRQVRKARGQTAGTTSQRSGAKAREQTRKALDALLGDLATRITDLGPRADNLTAPEAARRAYAEAVVAYGAARDALPGAGSSKEMAAVHRRLEEGLHAAAVAEAVLDGSDVPTPRRTARLRRRSG